MDFSEEYILNELGLQNQPENVKQAVVAIVYDTFNKRVIMALSDKLTDEQLKTFGGMVGKASDDEIVEWIDSNIPDSKEVIASEMKTMLEEMKNTFPRASKDSD